MPPHRAVLLRACRAAGLAADHHGGLRWIDVELHTGAVEPRAQRVGDVACLRTSVAEVSGASPSELLERWSAQLAASPRGPAGDEPPCARPARRSPAPVVLLDNPFRDPDRPGDERPELAGGSWQLASALVDDGIEARLVAGALADDGGFDGEAALLAALQGSPPPLVGLTVLEACVPAVRALAARIVAAGPATVVLGGPMPTLTPEHALAHVPAAGAVVRGAGERVLPTLARLLPRLDPAAQRSILELEGVIVVRERLLLAGHPGRVQPYDGDGPGPAFELLRRRHLQRGLSLETGRGCRHGCGFCTTPGKGRYRGRPAAAVAAQLRRYRVHLDALYHGRPPASARRVQLCDDDFGCDPPRAAAVLDAIAEEGFALAALQASVRDFLPSRRDRRALDTTLLDALRPERFQDAARHAALGAGPVRAQLPGDAGGWVHLGVESFADADLRRLGKGYRSADAAAVVDALDARGIVHDAYLLLGNEGTSLDDLIDSLRALARLKIEHPHTFFLRLPVVPFVVPSFPSARFAALVHREGALPPWIQLDGWWRLDGAPEYDYPVVARELPRDPDVRDACAHATALMAPDPLYLAPAERLRRRLLERLPGIDEPRRAARVRQAIRRLAGLRRRLIFRGVARARRGELPERVAHRYWTAAGALGPAAEIAAEARAYLETGDPRLVVLPTRDCSLRCGYCPADKRPGRTMDRATFAGAVELLLSTDHDDVILQFFGGEALLRRGFVLDGIRAALRAAADAGKRLGVILSTNGVALDERTLDRLARWPVKVELSLDGPPAVHDRHRRLRGGGGSYEQVVRCAAALQRSGLAHDVIMVVTPETVASLCDSFAHVAELGFRRIQINYALATPWSAGAKRTLADQLRAIERRFFAGPRVDDAALEFLDLRSYRHPMLLNGEITVDVDGTVHFGNGFLVRGADVPFFRAGHLDDLANLDTYLARRPDNDALIAHTYPPGIARNNLTVGRIYGSFVRHMRARFPELGEPRPTSRPGRGGGIR